METAIKDEFVPNVAATGSVGTLSRPWGAGHFAGLAVAGQAVEAAGWLGRLQAGEAISGARMVYFLEESGQPRIYRASAMDAAKWASAFIVEAVAEGALVDVWAFKRFGGLSGILPGRRYFLGADGEFALELPAGLSVYQSAGTGVSSAVLAARVEEPSFIIH